MWFRTRREISETNWEVVMPSRRQESKIPAADGMLGVVRMLQRTVTSNTSAPIVRMPDITPNAAQRKLQAAKNILRPRWTHGYGGEHDEIV